MMQQNIDQTQKLQKKLNNQIGNITKKFDGKKWKIER